MRTIKEIVKETVKEYFSPLTWLFRKLKIFSKNSLVPITLFYLESQTLLFFQSCEHWNILEKNEA
jgi:hypothetical protein